MIISRAREESAEKKSAAAELTTEKMKSSNENSTISESVASVKAELAEWASLKNSTSEMPQSLALTGSSTSEKIQLTMSDAASQKQLNEEKCNK